MDKWPEDIFYETLSEEEKDKLRKEVALAVKKENPHSDNPNIKYVKHFLMRLKLREIIRKRYYLKLQEIK